jgi:class 3 adenylate cyclase/tetratricopeptide (TPR) repeat protein
MTCPECQAENPAGSRFCNQCGAALAIVCPACEASNPPGSRFCNRCGRPTDVTPTARRGPAPPAEAAIVPAMSPILGGEERRPVTVVFADIVGFTALSERLDPEEVRDVTAACFGRLVEEIARRGGTVDKFIGDAVMALFGAPLAHEDDPARAVDAALAMQSALNEINGELERDHDLRLELRIGVNTGEVIAGVRQVGGFHDFTVIGDTVNTASRLQTAALPGTVVVGETTARLASSVFEFEPLPPLRLRGKAEPVAAFQAIGPLAGPAIPRAENVPLIGREAELAILAERVARLAEGAGQVLVITGDPGVGKSRMLGELRRMVEADGRIRWSEAHATPYGPGQTYRLYASILRALLGCEGWPPEEVAERLPGRLSELDASEALPWVSRLLDLPLDRATKARLERLSADEIQEIAPRAMQRLGAALAEEQPYVLAIDDLQWADPSVMEYLEGALSLVPRVPFIVCLVFRPDRDAPCWALKERAEREVPERYTEIGLGPLAKEESRELIRRLLGGAPVDAPAEARLLALVEGNPLFAEESVQTLIERGALFRRDGRWELDMGAAGRVPETLQATILARIDRLPEEARQVVQTGAVLGRTFSHQFLAHVAGDGPALRRGLREALRAGLLRERERGRLPGYTFTHTLIQEVAEQTLLLRRRRELHRAAVEAIVALYPDQLALHAEGLARHAFGGEVWSKAVRYAGLAAERAAEAYATRQALKLYTLGLEAAERLEASAEPAAVEGLSLSVARLLSGKARILSRLGRIEDAAAALEEALERAARPDILGDEEADPARLRARLALDLARTRILAADLDGVDRAVEIAFANLRADQPELASAWSVRSWVLMYRGDLRGSAAAARTAKEIAIEHGGFEQRAEAYAALTKPGLAGEIGPTIKTYAEEAIRLAREHQHDGYLFDALIGLEILRLICLQPVDDRAVDNAVEAFQLARKMDSVPAERVARVVLGSTYLLRGRWDEAERELLAAAAGALPLPNIESLRLLVLAMLWTLRGRLAEALKILEAGVRGGQFPHTGVWVNVEIALNRLLAGEPDMARAALDAAEAEQARLGCLTCGAALAGYGSEILARLGDDRALDLAARAEAAGRGAFPLARLQARRARALLAMRDGDLDAALAELDAARPLSDETGQPYEQARTRCLLAEARARRAAPGEIAAARAELEAALDTFAQLGAAPAQALARAQLDALSATRAAAPR